MADIPAEDSGFLTAGWYRYQYAVTAARCVELFVRSGTVLVEWHTDFAVTVDDQVLLVSVKHRDPSRGAWTIAALCADGGLETLRARWLEMEKLPKCELLTNAGFSSKEDNAKHLVAAMAAGDLELVKSSVITKIAKSLDCDEADAKEFLSSLAITTTSGDSSTIDGILIERAVRPVLESIGVSADLSRRVYRAALDLVREVAAGCDSDAKVWAQAPVLSTMDRESRRIDATRLLAAVNQTGPPLDVVVESGVVQAGGSRLVKKLRAGGLGPTVIAGAPSLRAEWYAVESAFRDDLPGRFVGEVERTRRAVLAIAEDAEAKSVGAASFGVEMHTEVRKKLAAGLDVQLPLDPSSLLGCAYQLADECLVWWSPTFDIRNEAPWVVDP